MTKIDPDKLMRLRDEMIALRDAADNARMNFYESEKQSAEAVAAFMAYAEHGDEPPAPPKHPYAQIGRLGCGYGQGDTRAMTNKAVY
jgi:hypothetical protein